MDATLEYLVSNVLKLGLDDWVYLAEVDYLVRDHLRGEPPEVTKTYCFAVLEHLLANGLAEAGDLQEVGGKVQFVPWDMDTRTTLCEVESRWFRFAGPRDEGGASDVCWLSNTQAGDELARYLSGSR